MRIACDGETVYGLKDTYKTEEQFVERFYMKFGTNNFRIEPYFGVQMVMLKELKGKEAPNDECGLYEREDGDIPAFKCILEEWNQGKFSSIVADAERIVDIHCDVCDYETGDLSFAEAVFKISMETGYYQYDGKGGCITKCPKCGLDKLTYNS